MRFTDYAKNGILNHYFGGSAWSNTDISKMQVGLFTADPTSAGSTANEIGTIARQDIAFDAVSQHVISNNADITFDTSSTTNGTVATHMAVFDDHVTTPHMLCYGQLTNSITIDNTKDIVASIDGIVIGVDTNSEQTPVPEDYAFPDAIVDEILEFVFRLGTIPSQPAAWQVSLPTNESLDGTANEWSGGNYSRQTVTWNSVSAGTGSFREVTNNGAIQFANQSQTPVAMWGIWDVTNTKFLAMHDVNPDVTVVSGDNVDLADQAMKISID